MTYDYKHKEMSMKLQITQCYSGRVIFEHDIEDNTMLATVKAALAAGANLRDADLSDADLSDADLRDADLSGANLSGAAVGGGTEGQAPKFAFTPDPDLPRKVAEAALSPPEALDMNHWHTCNTTHCLAGWAVHLSGPAGYALEAATSPSVAGAMLMPSAAHLFYSDGDTARVWLNEQIAPKASA